MDIAMRMTLVLLLLHTPSSAKAISIALAATGLVIPRIQRMGVFWILLAASRFLLLIPESWYRIDNHQYLIIYWCVGLGVAQFTANAQITAKTTARLLIGLTFLLATLWKISSPEFINGTFMEFTLISDSRFEGFTEFVGGLSAEQIQENVTAVRELRATAGVVPGVPLHSTDSIGVIALALSAWTIIFEAAIAAAFLLPKTWLYHHRDVILTVFIVTTYPIAPVVGFGWLLVAMGVCQIDPERTGLKAAYLTLFAALPILE